VSSANRRPSARPGVSPGRTRSRSQCITNVVCTAAVVGWRLGCSGVSALCRCPSTAKPGAIQGRRAMRRPPQRAAVQPALAEFRPSSRSPRGVSARRVVEAELRATRRADLVRRATFRPRRIVEERKLADGTGEHRDLNLVAVRHRRAVVRRACHLADVERVEHQRAQSGELSEPVDGGDDRKQLRGPEGIRHTALLSLPMLRESSYRHHGQDAVASWARSASRQRS
jgi:hypothetical protein